MLTGYSSIATAVEAVKRGAFNYLCKPAGIDEILAAFGAAANAANTGNRRCNRIRSTAWNGNTSKKYCSISTGNISATARALGMHRRTLQRKLQKRPVKN